MAYEIIKRPEKDKANNLLDLLHGGVKKREQKKGQIHKVFEESFDAKECYNEEFIFQKLDYIHRNPISKKWNLVNDFADYEYSNASFYEKGIKRYESLVHISDALSGKLPGSLVNSERRPRADSEKRMDQDKKYWQFFTALVTTGVLS